MSYLKTDSCKLSAIDFGDRSFPFSYGVPPRELLESIERVGLLQPPLLLESTSGYKIVCGRRRLLALQQSRTGDKEIDILSASEGRVKELFRRALWENLALRAFNLVETADIYVQALKMFSENEIADEICPALQIPRRERFHKRLQAIAGFSQELRDLLAAGVVDAESVDLIREWGAPELKVLIELIAETGLRRNKLREVIGRVDDLARRDGVSPCEPLLAAVAVVRDVEGKIDIGTLRNQLKVQLYPHLTTARRDFSEKLRQLDLPAKVRLESPPDFEGGEFRLSFSFCDSKQWQSACEKLNSIILEDIDEICSRS